MLTLVAQKPKETNMKSTMSLILLATVILVSCSKKISPAQQTAAAPPAQATQVSPPPPPVEPATRSIDVKADQGKIVYQAKCGKCHGLKNPADFTVSQWDGIMRKMGPNARLTTDETDQVVAYVRSLAKK